MARLNPAHVTHRVMMCVYAKFRTPDLNISLMYHFWYFSITHPQEQAWLGDPKVFGLKSILDVGCIHPEAKFLFNTLVRLEMDTYKHTYTQERGVAR